MAKSRRDNPLANGGENAPSAGHSGAPRLHEKERERNESGQAFRYSDFFGMRSDTPAETLSRYRYLKKGESGKQKSRRTMAGQENSDSKNPIYETLSQDVLLNVSGRIRFRSDREGVFPGKKAIIYFHVPGRYSMAFSDQTVGIRGKDRTFNRFPGESSRHSMKNHEAQPKAGIQKI